MKKEKPTTKLCKHCKTEIPFDAKVCPQCRKKQGSGCLVKILVVFAVIAILVSVFGESNDSDTQKGKSGATTQAESEQNADTKPDSDEELSGLSLGQKNALASAKNYLSFAAFSRDGLIHQLEYEQYSAEDATFAVDNCGADWNEQAVAKAKNYLDTSAFSYSGLIKQLEYEKFTSEQATYGVDNCGADWNEQAAKKAQQYLDMSAFSRADLVDQLLYEGFTAEQTEYGVTAAGY